MASHGLKTHNQEHYETAREIVNTMKQGAWESMTPSERNDVRAHHDKYCRK
jgi:hypothetical protein